MTRDEKLNFYLELQKLVYNQDTTDPKAAKDLVHALSHITGTVIARANKGRLDQGMVIDFAIEGIKAGCDSGNQTRKMLEKAGLPC